MNAISNKLDMKRSERQRGEEKQKRRKGLVILLIALAAAAAITAALILISQSGRPQRIVSGDMLPLAGAAAEGHLPGLTDEEIQAQMQKAADEAMFSFKINAQPVFEDGSSKGTLRIENPNHNVYPFAVEIYLDETGEKIYESGAVLPNHHIDTAKLQVLLPQGTHAATAYINAYDPETNEYQGKSAVNLSLIIKN